MKTGCEGRDLHHHTTQHLESRRRALEQELRDIEGELTWRWAALCDYAMDKGWIQSSADMPRDHQRPGGLAEIEQEYPSGKIYRQKRDADDLRFRRSPTPEPFCSADYGLGACTLDCPKCGLNSSASKKQRGLA